MHREDIFFFHFFFKGAIYLPRRHLYKTEISYFLFYFHFILLSRSCTFFFFFFVRLMLVASFPLHLFLHPAFCSRLLSTGKLLLASTCAWSSPGPGVEGFWGRQPCRLHKTVLCLLLSSCDASHCTTSTRSIGDGSSNCLAAVLFLARTAGGRGCWLRFAGLWLVSVVSQRRPRGVTWWGRIPAR